MKINDDEIKRICSPTIYKRGMEYYKEGRVHLKLRKPDSITAAVDGEQIYNVHISFDKNKIRDFLCTCPYYQTMGSACKHIVAALKTRQDEINETAMFENENDLLAAKLCAEFEPREKTSVYISLVLRITPVSESIEYSAGIKLIRGGKVFPIPSVEKFLDCIVNNREFKLSKNILFSPSVCYFEGASAEVMEILSEAYENKSASSGFYTPRLTETSFGAATAKRIFSLLEKIDCEYIIDSISYHNLPIIEDDPDIIVDVAAVSKNISISLSENPIALSPDGEWFFFENKIFKTSRDWQEWFMPIYRTMPAHKRTQLDFARDNGIEFASKVLPRLKDKRGVAFSGIDELIVNEKPSFEVYFDRRVDSVSAVVKANYGDIPILLPSEVYSFEKIIVRDRQAEGDVLSFFSEFSRLKDSLTLSGDDEIFHFLTHALPGLERRCTIYKSDSFNSFIKDMPDITLFVDYNKKIDLLELTVDSELSDGEIASILNAYHSSQGYFRLSDGGFLDFSRDNKILDVLDGLSFDGTNSIKGTRGIDKFYSLYLAQKVQSGEISSQNGFSDMISDAMNSKADIPAHLTKILRGYQKTGVHWFCQLSRLGLGGILADDMGLGKTLQVIAFIMSEKPENPALVIAPSSLIYNWLGEIERFAPEAKAKIIDGSKEEREKNLETVSGYNFIITSYALLRRDIKEYKDITFSYCFIDEAQHIKNPGTMNARAVKKIKAERYFALTGTPIENSLSELWSIFDFVLQGYLQSHSDFSKKFEKPSQKGDSRSLVALRDKIRPFILRRMKKDVLSELPEKIENTILADFEEEQKQIYSAFLSEARKEADIIASSGESTIRILSLLTRLRQICCHPGLINPQYKKESGKLTLLNELVISAIESGHRVLIFSQFTSMLNIIAENFRKIKIDCFYLDGSTPPSERLSLANRFNGGEKQAFLISLKAGGTGLNLTGADMVIHYDPWWNPAVMDQASDRAYRIGQTRAVQVIKLAARHSIEEQILKLAEKKRSLADGVIRENASLLSALTKEELLRLFEDL